MATMKKYSNNFIGLALFQKNLQEAWNGPNLYEKLKASLWDWFTPQCNLKPNYIHAKQLGTMVKKNFKNMPILKEYLETLK